MLWFNDTSTLVDHFVSSPREREKRDSRRDEREEKGRKRNRSESEETEKIKKIPPSTLTCYKDSRPEKKNRLNFLLVLFGGQEKWTKWRNKATKTIILSNLFSDMGRALRKRVFGNMRTVKAQISLRIRAVWSAPSLSANRIIGHYKMYGWRANARIRLCAYVEWIWMYILCMPEHILRLARPIYELNSPKWPQKVTISALYWSMVEPIEVARTAMAR